MGIGEIRAEAEQAGETHPGGKGGGEVSATPRTDKWTGLRHDINGLIGEARAMETELAAAKLQVESLTDRNAMMHSKLEKEKETSELLATSRDEWERQCAAVTKQRDELKSFVLSIVDANGPHQDANGTSVIQASYSTLAKLKP